MLVSCSPAFALVAAGAALTAAPSAVRHAKVAAVFAAPASYKTHPAVTYDKRSVPLGARVQVVETPNDKGGKNVALNVWGLRSERRYDAYVYTRRCGPSSRGAGERVQDGPSREHYAQNEVWLNFRTNRSGDGTALMRQYWIFRSHEANSVVIQSHLSKAHVACITVPFS